MNEAQLYERIGRLQVELEGKQAQLETSIGVVRAIKAGEISIDRVVMTETGFQVLPSTVEQAEAVARAASENVRQFPVSG